MIFYICVQQKGLHQDPKEILSLFFPAFFVMLTDQKRHVGWRGVKSRKNVDISRNKAGSVRNSNFYFNEELHSSFFIWYFKDINVWSISIIVTMRFNNSRLVLLLDGFLRWTTTTKHPSNNTRNKKLLTKIFRINQMVRTSSTVEAFCFEYNDVKIFKSFR